MDSGEQSKKKKLPGSMATQSTEGAKAKSKIPTFGAHSPTKCIYRRKLAAAQPLGVDTLVITEKGKTGSLPIKTKEQKTDENKKTDVNKGNGKDRLPVAKAFQRGVAARSSKENRQTKSPPFKEKDSKEVSTDNENTAASAYSITTNVLPPLTSNTVSRPRPKFHSGLKLIPAKDVTKVQPFSFQTKNAGMRSKTNAKDEPIASRKINEPVPKKITKRRNAID